MDEGSKIPEIPVTMDDAVVSLASLGTPLVVYFYPKDDTSGCTTEAKDFSALSEAFGAAGVTVVGVSKDTAASHAKFTAKHGLAVRLASDVEGVACEAFGVWVEKAMYGRKYMGIERATFLFDTDGTLAKAWRKVRVAGHAEAVLAAAKAL
jgi:peroxiredoxin Q/BCP